VRRVLLGAHDGAPRQPPADKPPVAVSGVRPRTGSTCRNPTL